MLVDATWGRGFSEKTGRGLESFNKFDDYWFLTPPSEFRFSHLPLDKKWQLVESKITLDDFNKCPLVGKREFKMGLKADDILKSALDGNLSQLVTVYETPFPVKIVEIPYQKILVAGKAYKFQLESHAVKYIRFVEKWEWIPVEKEGNIFTTVVTPKVKTLKIEVAINPNYGGSTLLLYDVKERR